MTRRSQKAQERADYISLGHTGKGWLGIIQDLDKQIAKIAPHYEIDQIKEKFGALRYYYDIPLTRYEKHRWFYRWFYWNIGRLITNKRRRQRAKINPLVAKAERDSVGTCEYCGAKDNVSTCKIDGYWLKTVCRECYDRSQVD